MDKFREVKIKRKKFHIIRGVREIEKYIDDLPKDDECFKFISTGGFSSICFIKFIADKCKINELNVSTFRIGKKELRTLDILHKEGRLGRCNLLVALVMKKDSKKTKSYGYYDDVEGIFEKNNWSLTPIRNHSKILLFDTENGKYVIETSSNLNENPQIEQFSFSKDASTYDFYHELFEKIKSGEVI